MSTNVAAGGARIELVQRVRDLLPVVLQVAYSKRMIRDDQPFVEEGGDWKAATIVVVCQFHITHKKLGIIRNHHDNARNLFMVVIYMAEVTKYICRSEIEFWF